MRIGGHREFAARAPGATTRPTVVDRRDRGNVAMACADHWARREVNIACSNRITGHIRRINALLTGLRPQSQATTD
jgi:hypothetical protein